MNANVRNEGAHHRFGIAPIVKELRKKRLRGYGYAIRREENSINKMGLNI